MEKVTKRKVFAASASAALVASAVVPAATFAATSDFTDISNLPASEQAAINALVDAGFINGKGDGKFDPYAQMKRAEAATVIAKVLGLDVNNAPSANFADVADNYWAKNYINAAVEAGILEGKGDGKFDPEAPMKRAELAQIVVKAFDLKLVEGKDNNFTDVADNYWGKEAIDILYSNGLITGKSETRFAPEERMQRNHVALLLQRAIDPASIELQITNVSALTDDGHVLKVEFSQPVRSIDKANVSLFEKASKSRVGIERVELASDGKSAEIFAYDNTSEGAPDEVKRGVEYTLQINNLTYDFTRPYYLDERRDARVTEIDAKDKDFVVSYDADKSVTIKVPNGVDFDYEAAVGMEIRVWYDGNRNLVDYEIADESRVLYDAFEVNDAKDEIELQTADKEYDLATDKDNKVTTVYYLNGKEVKDLSKLKDASYAKIILDDDGDVAYIYAYDLEDLTVVESVKGNIVEGLGDQDLDLEDFVIVKDGKTIQISDLEEGDAIYYNEKASNSLDEEGYAVVYNKTITGDIETIYDDSFIVNGKKYSYSTISFLNEDNEIEAPFTKDDAEDFESDEVTIYINYEGDIQLLTGVQVDAGNDVGALLTADALVWEDNKNKVSVELEYVTQEGEEKLTDVSFDKLDTITVDGVKYDIEQDANERDADEHHVVYDGTKKNNLVIQSDSNAEKARVVLSDNTSIIVTQDDDGNVTDLEVFKDNKSAQGDLEEDIEPGDKYAKFATGDKRLQNNTIIFVAEDGAKTDADDVEVYRFADIDFDIDKATAEVYYDKNGNVEMIVVEDTVAASTTEVFAVVDSYSTTSGDVTRLVAYVDGKKTTYTVNKVKLGTTEELKALLADGQVVKLKVNNESGVVDKIFVYGDNELTGDYFLLNQKGATGITSNKFTLGTTEYQKGDNFQIIDATKRSDLDTETSLNSIKGKKFHVILEAKGSRFVDTIVIIGDEDAPNDDNYLDTTDPVVTVHDGTDALEDGDVFANGDTLKITVTAGSDTVDSVSLVKDSDPAENILTAAIGAGHTIATDGTKDGSYKLTFTASDAAGNEVTDTINFVVDGTAPTQIVDSGATNSASEFSLDVTEANSYTVSVTNSTLTVATASVAGDKISFTAGVVDGETVEVTVEDAAGNKSVKTYKYVTNAWVQQ